MDENEMKAVLTQYGQEHVLKAYERADLSHKEIIRKQVEKIDFVRMQELYHMSCTEVQMEETDIVPMHAVVRDTLPEDQKKAYLSLGESIIRSGKLAVVTMAGGQGTRLGHNGPKGTYDIGLASHKSLFAILTDTLQEACKRYETHIPWYIMTSQENYKDTKSFFEAHHYFDYPQEDVHFFQQGGLPMLDEQGKVIINEEGIIKEAADGHGGVFEAMFREGVLQDMKNRGIEWIFMGSVDNPLVKMVDPLMVGFGAFHSYEAVSKTLAKASPKEKIGVFCKKNGKTCVIEYSEMPEELANKRDENGNLLYEEGHVMLNLFQRKMIETIEKVKLPYHSAHKKATWMDEEGNVNIPEKPNAYKYESFLFDAFSLLDDMGLIRGVREDDFAPVKNATGEDSPATAKALYEAYWKRQEEGESSK